MKKRALSVLLAFVMCLALCPVTALAAEGDFTINVYGTLIAYNGSGGDIVIPDSVKSIDKNVFSGAYHRSLANSITSVVIPDSVTSIGNGAFQLCTNLTSVTIGNGVKSIGDNAFRSCESLKTLTMGNSIETIGAHAFWYCISLQGVTLPNSLTKISQSAFEACESLTSVTIPGKVTAIEAMVFSSCTSLTNVTLHNNITEIGIGAFGGCTSLEGLTIPRSVTSIGSSAFSGCPIKSINIPDGVKSIYYSTFSGCSGLTEVTLPSSVTKIERYAFRSCANLTDITIPHSVTSIHEEAFIYSSNLKITGYSGSAAETFALTKMIPFTSLGQAPANPANPTGPTAPPASKDFEIKDGVLLGYNGSASHADIPSGVTSIGQNAFYSCTSLTSITIPNSVTSIGNGAFNGCSSLTSITIPNSVTSIGNYAFNGCSSLISITIPNSVTSIGDHAFYYCTSLTSITIPNSVTSVAAGAFSGCTSLTSVTIPKSVTSIGNGGFDKNVTFTIYGDTGSYAETYAKDTNRPFVSIGGTPPPADPAPNVASASSWARDDINQAYQENLIPPTLQAKYTQATTRAEFCALAVALYENVTGVAITGRKTFSDTTDVNVQKAAAAGIVNGVGGDKFDPHSGLTREQAATMLARLAEAVGKPIAKQAATFADKGKVSSWALDAVGQMQATGIMGGVGNNTFDPKGAYAREQSIVTILRLYDILQANAADTHSISPSASALNSTYRWTTSIDFGYVVWTYEFKSDDTVTHN